MVENIAKSARPWRIPWLLILGFLFVDQGTKFWAVTILKPMHTMEVIPHLLNLSYVENPGAAWGILSGRQVFLIFFSLLTLAALFWKRHQLLNDLPSAALIFALLMAGILGNLIDRIRLDHVIDFIDFYWGTAHFPAFNVADSAICCATFLLLLTQWLHDRRKKSGSARKDG